MSQTKTRLRTGIIMLCTAGMLGPALAVGRPSDSGGSGTDTSAVDSDGDGLSDAMEI